MARSCPAGERLRSSLSPVFSAWRRTMRRAGPVSGRKGETPASDVGALKNRDLNQVSSPIMRIAPSTAPQWPERDAHIVSAGYDPLLTLANLQTSVIGSKAEADLLCLAAFGESVR